MQKIKRLTREEALHNLNLNSNAQLNPARQGYLAMFSTWTGGIITDLSLMSVPVDDHIVHRGDGVFEAIKCIAGKLYALRPHLERLERSAAAIEINLPHSLEEISQICRETLRVAMEIAGSTEDFMLRLYISRGPGGFTTNPYETLGAQLYLVITRYNPVPEAKYQTGVSIGTSSIGVKEGRFAQIKSCNYLANVLMKKEAVDRKLDFTLSLDASGAFAESSTENFAIVSAEGEFLIPHFDRTLRGITAVRVMELAAELVKSGELKAVRNSNLYLNDVLIAKEAMMLGTTLDVLPVVEFDGKKIGEGRPGINTLNLLRLLRHDIRTGLD